MLRLGLVLCCVASVGCLRWPWDELGASSADGGRDAGVDADGVDAARDVGPADTGPADVGVDGAGPDVGDDAGFDAGFDANIDAGSPLSRCRCTDERDECVLTADGSLVCQRLRSRCTAEIPCPSGYRCRNSRCECNGAETCARACDEDVECQDASRDLVCDVDTQRCRLRRGCLSDHGCAAGERCLDVGPGPGRCGFPGSASIGAECSSDAECASGLCDARCVTSCRSDADCGRDEHCRPVGRANLGACTAGEPPCDCGASLVCAGGCVRLCVGGQDCPMGEGCDAASATWVCSPRRPPCGEHEVRSQPLQRCELLTQTCWRAADDCPDGYSCIRARSIDVDSALGTCQRSP